MEASAVEIRLRNHEERISANHDSLAKVRDTSARHDTEISVMRTELRESRDDISEIRRTIEADRAERKKEREEAKKEGSDTRKALYVTAATMFTFFLSIVGLIATLLNHA